jgi:hypothetical protein
MASAGSQTLRGAALVLVAVIVGVVLLNVVDDGGSPPRTAAGASDTTGDANDGDSSSTTRTTAPKPIVQPAELAVRVLNGGGPAGSAGAMREALVGKGYTNQPEAKDDLSNQERQGNFAFCKRGLQRELAALAEAVGTGTTSKLGIPAGIDPLLTDGMQCLVIVGATTSA